MRKRSIKTSIVVAVALGIIALTCVNVLFLVSRSYIQSKKDSQQLLLMAVENFDYKLKETINTFSLAIELMLTDEAAASAFAARDRATLLARQAPLFESMNQRFGIEQLHYHLPPATSFLRVNMPQKFGDDLSTFRATVVEVNKTLKPVFGLEVGANSAGIRVLYPVFHEGSHVGSVELVGSFSDAVKGINTLFGLEFAVGIKPDFFKAAGKKASPDDVEAHGVQYYSFSSETARTLVAKDQPIGKEISFGKSSFTTGSIPLKDFSGADIGHILVIENLDKTKTALMSLIVTSIVISGLVMLLTLAIVIFTIVRSLRPLNNVVAMLRDISVGEGDLTKTIEVTTNDEISEMAEYFNLTFEKIRFLVSLVQRQSVMLREVGVNLASTMTETAAAINEISANIQSIKNQTMNQSASVTETSATMEQISKGIDGLNQLIDDQSANVTESSSAIEEMMANIGSVTQTLIKNTGNIKKLLESSETGKTVLDKITVAIRDVAKESEGLMEISKVIQGIANQTNLLSMNAAIEAAHAGDSGKGFAVVADEIRKLSESSSAQTKTITTVLRKIKDSMVFIIKFSDEVVSNFTTIENHVKTVAEQEEVIRRAMEEQSAGSKQVLEATTVLNDITQKVQASSKEMLTGTNRVSKEARNINDITQEITGGMNEMASGAEQVVVAVNAVNELSVRNKSSIDELINEVNKFKV